ncbi:hypothetical protein Ancab_028535 [Ancistrocladus abbreviatus]
MANEEESPGNVRLQLAKLFDESLRATVPSENVEPLVAACSGQFGDYQCNNAMGLFGEIKGKNTEFKNPNSLGQAIARNLPLSEMVASHSVAGPGFVNIVLSNTWLAESIQKMLVDGIQTWAPELCIKKANTAVYLLYAHARICSIIWKSGKDIEDLKKVGEIALDQVDEHALGLHLLQFSEIVEDVRTNLLPSVLCEYLYNLSELFSKFYDSCQVHYHAVLVIDLYFNAKLSGKIMDSILPPSLSRTF